MSNKKYYDDDYAEIDGLLHTTPISQIAPSVPMSKHTLRMRCKKLGIKPVQPNRRKAVNVKQVNEMMGRWGR